MLNTYDIGEEIHMFDPKNIVSLTETNTGTGKAIIVQLGNIPMPLIIQPKESEYEDFRKEIFNDFKKAATRSFA